MRLGTQGQTLDDVTIFRSSAALQILRPLAETLRPFVARVIVTYHVHHRKLSWLGDIRNETLRFRIDIYPNSLTSTVGSIYRRNYPGPRCLISRKNIVYTGLVNYNHYSATKLMNPSQNRPMAPSRPSHTPAMARNYCQIRGRQPEGFASPNPRTQDTLRERYEIVPANELHVRSNPS